MAIEGLALENSYARDLNGLYVPWQGAAAPAPRMIRFNRALAEELGLPADRLEGQDGAAILSGSETPESASPLAMAYAGHQFGHFSPQLGDGRALLIGEVIDREGRRRDIHLKGSGKTPFSRGGDGKAVLGPVLREYLMGEAMHALGIPTTRALAAIATGEQVFRETLQPGAVLARVAASHLRVGTFQFFAARGDHEKLGRLADYAIARHDPDLSGQPDRHLRLLERVCQRQAALIARWMLVGFIHGVMNTDNMTISGETIDYGPCAFMDAYDRRTVFSSIDHAGRYAFGNQPGIAQWNLARLAEALLPLIDAGDEDAAIRQATEIVSAFGPAYEEAWQGGMRAKLGLGAGKPGDTALIEDLLALLERGRVDFTGFFRALASAAEGDGAPATALFDEGDAFAGWLTRWQERLAGEPPGAGGRMRAVTPVYIPRNHLVEAALQAAISGDMAPFDRLISVLATPFTEQAGAEAFAKPAPEEFCGYRTFCGT